MGAAVTGKPVTECQDLSEVLRPRFRRLAALICKRVYEAMKAVIEKRIPLVVTCAGPITVSDQHRAWLIPLIRGGEHGVHHGDRRDLLPRRPRLSAQDRRASDPGSEAVWRRCRVARERRHSRGRYRVSKSRSIRPGRSSHRDAATAGVPEADDDHGTQLSAGQGICSRKKALGVRRDC